MNTAPNEPPRVVVAHDDGYAVHGAVTLLSVLDHTPDAELFALVPQDFQQAARMQEAVGSALRIVRIDAGQFATLQPWEGGNRAPYLRLAIGESLAVPRVIYLDSDVIVRHDLTPLWRTDLGHAVLGAVPDISFAGRERLGFAPDRAYFNSGVLLIDLDRWRQERVGAQTIAWAQANPGRLSWADQCALNWVLQERWHALGPCWNMQAGQFGRTTRWGFRFDPALAGDPSIVHFTTPPAWGRLSDWEGKPWAYLCEHPWRQAYLDLFAQTPWRDQPWLDRYPHNRIRKALRRHADWALPFYLWLRYQN